MKAVILGLINIYCRVISPALPPTCRFQPTCSHYSHEAISTLGLARGGLFAMWRLLRCHPFTSGGFDPVHSGHIKLIQTILDNQPNCKLMFCYNNLKFIPQNVYEVYLKMSIV